MIKNIFKVISIICILFLTNIQSFSYNITEKDYFLIDTFEDKIYNLIDSKENLTAEKVVNILENFLENKNDRTKEILNIVIDDIDYDYDLWLYFYEEDEILTKQDCFFDEIFDEKNKTCYLKDEENYSDEDLQIDYSDENFNAQNEDEKIEEKIKTIYNISKNKIELISWIKDKKDLEIFNLFSSLIPINYRTDFKKIKIFDNPDSDIFAFVNQDEENNKKWNLYVNIANFYKNKKLDKKESIHTIIHEFSHILTLWKGQIRYVDSKNLFSFERAKNKCKNNFLQEWCLNKGSYLDDFINIFWKKDFEKSQNEEKNDFYINNENNFVTQYASSNPWEDISESFTLFVLKNKPTWNTIADKKILFFYNYPKLEKLRKSIRFRLEKFGK